MTYFMGGVVGALIGALAGQKKEKQQEEKKLIPIVLERKFAHGGYFCKEMLLDKPRRSIYVFEKDLNGANYLFPTKEIRFEVTDRKVGDKIIFTEV